MRLSKIKLAGFKSFVDPTTFNVPSQLVAIVGPNGCGKSNIIDAVRWVMGESSVRQLRGESMDDVIFNGSGSRKPVGQASIELVFDNSEGKLSGPWGRYSEIAIKRVLNRGGQSSYHINGTRCRRRDITAIFLGTGLGPRSYAIIEQGMISRVIDSKPDELRVILEEAAGISRYKERRRETENRIRHTRDNLARLNDVREELGRQLAHLKRQAANAERYKKYRAEERRLKTQLLTLRWRVLSEKNRELDNQLNEQENALQAKIAELRGLETKLIAGREAQAERNEALNEVQAEHYRIAAEIARVQQDLQHQRTLREQKNEELRRTEQALGQLVEQRRLDEERAGELTQELLGAEPELEEIQSQSQYLDEQLGLAEAALDNWRADWQVYQEKAADAQRAADVERVRIEQLERQQLFNQQRIERLRVEKISFEDSKIIQELNQLQQADAALAAALDERLKECQELDDELTRLRAGLDSEQSNNADLQERLQSARGRLSSLQTLQEAALGEHNKAVKTWLNKHKLDANPRLAQLLQVESGWEQAVEVVLDDFLEAVCVDENQFESAAGAALELTRGSLSLVQKDNEPVTGTASDAADVLSKKIDTAQALPLNRLLAGIGIAEDLAQALARRGQLKPGESLVTADGFWLGQDWLRLGRGQDNSGVLGRQRELQELQRKIAKDKETLAGSGAAISEKRRQLEVLAQQRSVLQDAVNRCHREQAGCQGQISALENRLQQQRQRGAVIDQESQELEQAQAESSEALAQARARLEQAIAHIADLAEEAQHLNEAQQDLRNELEHWRVRADDARQLKQRKILALERLRSEQQALAQALQRLQTQHAQLRVQREQLAVTGEDQDETEQHSRLDALLQAQVTIDDRLTQAREASQGQENEQRALEQARSHCEQSVSDRRQALESLRINRSELSVRQQHLLDQLAELDAEPNAILADLPQQADEAQWQQQLEALGARIQRLGAINLAAIEEYEQLAQREQYLDSQNNDLLEALTTLEEAMAKMDHETRSRFQEMYAQVDTGLGELFPRLFRGGKAYLELTGADTLDAGVTIMAQPPGKRIGNIHLLSGGEKALTAIALIFAIFQLNPAPFCLLDEVDAPLDENNVGRFGELLQELSEQVQFIVVTHNKTSMEIAYQLTGVTMHEPGVSRLVAVDIDEAVRLAAV